MMWSTISSKWATASLTLRSSDTSDPALYGLAYHKFFRIFKIVY
jgi:hypothetical protein